MTASGGQYGVPGRMPIWRVRTGVIN